MKTSRNAEHAESSYTEVLQVGHRVLLQVAEGNEAGTYFGRVVEICRDGLQEEGIAAGQILPRSGTPVEDFDVVETPAHPLSVKRAIISWIWIGLLPQTAYSLARSRI